MKIDLISSSLFGAGAQRVLVLLANYFVTRGHEVKIITFNKGDAYSLDSRISRVQLHSGHFKNHTLRTLSNLILHYRQRKNRPDVCISFISKMNFSAIISCKLFSIKVIACEHNNHMVKTNSIVNFTWNYLYRLADYVTVLTAFDKPFFESKGAKVMVMPNPSTFTPIAENNHLREKVILAVGSLNRVYHKGFDNLIVLIAPVLKQHPDWTLKIVGKGAGIDSLMGLASKSGVEKQIIFTGFRDDVNDLMHHSEIFILASRFEGLPMVLLEAMSQGMACLAYDCITGPSEMIQHNENGLLIKNQDQKEMQKGLLALINDESLRRRLSCNAIKSLDKYSIENVYSLWELLFNKVIK
jgi:GalNAc-alpha-(1->4)-GalNAc-alpha-(1->3)-diNAcBac-PP-undecaprenol alpha-1,4-N-acetyl-D-galactosaminyltransferase